jgi:leader peptidase (prepilin peptidase)/N-methyltransferase
MIFLIFILGLVFGSFLNSLIYRWYNNISLWGRSFCPNCQCEIKVVDLIPLVSFIVLRCKCRNCAQKISWQYFFIELTTGILFALAFWQHQFVDLFLIRNLFFILVLIFIFIFDLKYYLILDRVIWPTFIVALIVNLFLSFGIWNLLLGILIGAGFFGLQYLISRGKWIGLGDVKFGALLGVMFGVQMTLLIIVLAYIIGGILAVILLISRQKKFGEVLPMGTFLALSGIIVIFFGQQIMGYYLNLLGT